MDRSINDFFVYVFFYSLFRHFRTKYLVNKKYFISFKTRQKLLLSTKNSVKKGPSPYNRGT
ncbi:MAG: hypothetical protein COV01_01260 [Candidatus Taylorbacteria bacterium CG10_big_fil_rev_8_21_14_0_10_41_48]|uniref:Uncharacterized protein n=1 Tax=Candidatus Taylorbacteria bacterium CG10_big_fil_rev_8_21_14_0_10_41_48 TaxID=1975024 RepID=A0A2M8LCN1_9BACT|nr:MAG: hypothetical protein COV01_01260 [Candidatus Taylorbacteria bacterium CG10_big_fil_rev_8_21_14_0_10_41_48]